MPLVHPPMVPFSHLQLEWQLPDIRRWYERMAERAKLVRYDGRGMGLSDRHLGDYSLEAHVRDLEAVVQRLSLEEFVLLGHLHSGPMAIAYAARHPQRVSHLVLWCSYARYVEYARSPAIQAMRALRDKDWGIYTETTAHISAGWAQAEGAQELAAFLRECVTREDNQAIFKAMRDWDVTSLLPEVRSPTLVLHRRQAPFPDVSLAKGLASGIPDARLILLEGTTISPAEGGMEAVPRAIEEFVGLALDLAPVSSATPGSLVTVLFTDVEGSAALTQRLGDERARQLLREHERIVREALRGHGGSEIKTMGDGFMASFGSVTKAVECAVALQRAFAGREGEPLRIRVGLNAGEPIEEHGDLFGATVILASRIAAKAEGGEILVTDTVRGLCSGKGFLFAMAGSMR